MPRLSRRRRGRSRPTRSALEGGGSRRRRLPRRLPARHSWLRCPPHRWGAAWPVAGSRRLEVRGAGCIPKRAERGLAVSAGPSRRWLGSPPSRYSPADSPPRPRLPPGPDHRPQYELRQPNSALTPKLCHWDERLPQTTHQTHDHHQGRRRLPRPGVGEERRHHLCEVETQKNAGLPGRGSEKEPPC